MSFSVTRENEFAPWLRNSYHKVYEAICGRPPHKRVCHFSYLATKDLCADIHRVIPKLQGRILDVGCGQKPYRKWAKMAAQYVGIDVTPGPQVDACARCGDPWPFASACFDAVVCTQVLEYVPNLQAAVAEIDRVLKPGGYLVATVPFLHPQEPGDDRRRLTLQGMQELFAPRYHILEAKPQGRIGTILGLMCLGWINAALTRRRGTLLIKGAGLPIWIAFCGLVNGLCSLLDRLDFTGIYYTNVLIVAQKIGSEATLKCPIVPAPR